MEDPLLSGLQAPPIGHVHEDPLPRFVDTEGLSLFIDMGDHQLSDVMRIHCETPFTQSHLLQATEEEFVELCFLDDREGDPENREDA